MCWGISSGSTQFHREEEGRDYWDSQMVSWNKSSNSKLLVFCLNFVRMPAFPEFIEIFLLFAFLLPNCRSDQMNNVNFNKLPGLEKFEKVRLTERNFGLVRNMHANWFAAGVKALLGQLGRRLYGQLAKEEQTALAACLDRIEDKRDLVLAAQCLVSARRAHLRRISAKRMEEEGIWIGALKMEKSGPEKANFDGKASGRRKRAKEAWSQRSATKISRASKNPMKKMNFLKDSHQDWMSRMRQFNRDRKLLKGKIDAPNTKTRQKSSKWVLKNEESMPKFEIRQMDRLDTLANQQDRSAISRVTNLLSTLVSKGNNGSAAERQWPQLYQSLIRLKRANDQRQQSPGARVYDLRMYDLVLGREKRPSKKAATDLLTNLRFMSPRFAPLMPDKLADSGSASLQETLSPTIFALYDVAPKEKGKEADFSSLPQVLKAGGMNKNEREALLQLLMKVSGSIGHVQTAMDLLKGLNFFEIEPELTEANDRVLGAYTKMERSFEAEQEREIDRQGWTFLRRPQFDQLCQDQHAEFPEEVATAVQQFANLDGHGRELAIWRRIERIARDIPDNVADKLDQRRHRGLLRFHLDGKERRRRRQAPTGTNNGTGTFPGPFVGEPIILEPFMFTPTYGLSVLGPLVLSPNIFSPLVLAPSVLSPYILSPAAPIPYILSPYVFGPFILSPMALAPFILSPYVLSPNILNPFALSPLILSPNVLSPDILSPQVGGGAILSPVVGSPAILTNTALMASVLSPSVLSRR